MSRKSTMRRISPELDEYLQQLAAQLSTEMRRPVSVTDASKVLAAWQPQPMILMKKRREIRIRGSLISL